MWADALCVPPHVFSSPPEPDEAGSRVLPRGASLTALALLDLPERHSDRSAHARQCACVSRLRRCLQHHCVATHQRRCSLAAVAARLLAASAAFQSPHAAAAAVYVAACRFPASLRAIPQWRCGMATVAARSPSSVSMPSNRATVILLAAERVTV